MKNRIRTLIEKEKMTSVQFASKISIAPSSLHHIVSGRNNPSLDVIQKILLAFPHLNAEWLISGRGNQFKNMVQGELFSDFEITESNENQLTESTSRGLDEGAVVSEKDLQSKKDTSEKEIEKIIVFYTDKTFETYKESRNA